jgi:hypothetical protein
MDQRLPIAVKLKSGLETTASVKVTDHFSVVICGQPRAVRFAVKKAAARNRTYGLELSYGVDVTAMPGIDDVLDALFEAPEQLDKLRDAIRKRLAAAATWKAAAGFA